MKKKRIENLNKQASARKNFEFVYDPLAVKAQEPKSEFDFVNDNTFVSNAFTRSVENLTSIDIPAKEKSKITVREFAAKFIKLALILVCLTVLLVNSLSVIKSYIDYNAADKLYGNLSDIFESEDMPEIPQTPSTFPAHDKESKPSILFTEYLDATENNPDAYFGSSVDKLELLKIKIDWLREKNPDIYGWIKIDGTKVNYPITRGADNKYYLDHSYTGEYMIVGSIFADYRTQDHILHNYNTILYGHNMKDGSMFHFIEEMLSDVEMFDKKKIVISTYDGIYTYTPISIYKALETDQYFRMNFKNKRAFADFTKDIIEKSAIKRTVDLSENSRILTLSTCTNEERVERFVLHALLTDAEEAE